MACHCKDCSKSKRIGTFRQLQEADCSRAKSNIKVPPTKRHLIDKLNYARKQLIEVIDRDEDYKAMLYKRYGEIPKHIWMSGLYQWYKRDYVKALRNAQAAGIEIKA